MLWTPTEDNINRTKSLFDTGVSGQLSVNQNAAADQLRKKKKSPAPQRPLPQKRKISNLPLLTIQQELQEIEIKQKELERTGVSLERSIRNFANTSPKNSAGGSSGQSNSMEEEELVIQLFEVVNEKNILFRRQTELAYM